MSLKYQVYKKLPQRKNQKSLKKNWKIKLVNLNMNYKN